MTNALRTIPALLALALAAPALAQQSAATAPAKVGLGVGLTGAGTSGQGSPDFGTLLFVPVHLAPNLRIEPFLGWARADVNDVPVQGNPAGFAPIAGYTSDFTIGVGGFFVQPTAPQLQLYAGGRLASQWQTYRTNGGEKWERRNTVLAAAAGAEYLPIPRVALGAEFQLGLVWYGSYDVIANGQAASGGGGSGSATQATLFARFYLF